MRKLFLLISVLTLSIVANAATININTETADALRLALNSANDGDEIVMAAGTYVESNGGYIAFTGKHVTVKAADGENVIIQPKVPVTIAEGGCAHFENVKFDVSKLTELADWYEHLIYATDANTSNSMILDGCEIYGFTLNKSLLFCGSDYRLASVTITNCYFHNIKKSCLFIQSTEAINISISNSTFANITTESSYYAGVIDSRATSGSFSVDHCTFYNVQAMSTDYAAIGQVKLESGAVVSNCIFAFSESAASSVRTIRDKVAANNNLVYNYTADSGYGMQGNVTKTNCNIGNPLFTDPDAATPDFSYAGNWSTGSISPARGAATDGSDLGDPRWYSAETLPSTNFASPYQFVGAKAHISGNIWYDSTNEYLYYNDKSECGVATWKINVTRACIVEATLNMNAGTTTDHQFRVKVLDADGNSIGETAEASATSAAGNIALPNRITLPAAGNYTIKLYNDKSWSSAKVNGITLSYYGGAVQNISTSTNTTLNVADAWFSGCTRDNDKTYIQYPSSETSSAWIKWNIATSETKYYDLTANINTDYAHGFTIAIYEDEEAEPIASVTEGSYVNTQGVLALELGRVNLVGGKNYVVKVTNAPSGSQAKVTSVVFAPVVATATELPGTLAFSNAVLSEKANITDGMLYFNEPGEDKDPRGQWAQWEVTTDHDGLFLFTMGVTSTNGQNYKITIKDDGDNELDYYETSLDSGDKTVTHYFALATGNYFVKVENTRSYSKGHLTSLVVTEPVGVVTLDEAATDNTSWSDKVVNKEAAGPLYDVQIKRTIKAGMYNTFCLPFAVSPDMCKDIFGSDVQIRTLDSATVDEDFVLTLDFKKSSDIYPGTPVLIQTSRDIVNPVFTGVKFTIAAPSATTKTNANFTGTFVKTALEANENILFLGANNKLYFPTALVDIYGMRGWFVIHGVSASAIKRARIVENHNTATDIEIVGSQKKVESQKLIENGQLIIIRDGIRYNVMGARVK